MPRVLSHANIGDEAVTDARQQEQTWYFTFGFGQPNEGRYYIIEDSTADEARNRMHVLFDRVWGFQYSEAEWVNEQGVTQADEYGLRRIA